MWFKTKVNDAKRWFKHNTRTIEDRFWFALAACFFIIVGGAFLSLMVIMWKLFLFLFGVFIAIALVTSPIWIWIIKGEK